MRRRAGPVQQWVDSIPSPTKPLAEGHAELNENPTPPLTPVSSKESRFSKPSMTVSTPISVPNSPIITMTGVPSPVLHNRLARDPSFQSDSSHCSSVESLLELRRADPEAILLGLGFGGCPNSSQENGPLSRIPKRFLQPSKLQGIAINDFVKQQQETSESLDSASLGYRGLTGSPYVAPSEIVQKIMERLREHESHEQDAYTVHNNNTEPYSPIFQDTSRLSVLSPDNRQFLERPRSKSPDMRNKRMIIGQKSFAFGCDGDLIEINPLSQQQQHSRQSSTNGNTDNHEIELEDDFAVTQSLLCIDLNSTYQNNNNSKETKSAISNGRQEKRLAKQMSIDGSAQDLNYPDNDSLLEANSYTRSCDTSLVPTNFAISETVRGDSCDGKCETHDDSSSSDEDRVSSNDLRRASDGSCDIKMPWGRLSREDGRRYSDGVLKLSSSLLNRRRSLKRQSRISDAEAVQYCEIDEPTNSFDKKDIETTRISEDSKLEVNDTEGRNNRSDRLLNTLDTENCTNLPTIKLPTIDVEEPAEISSKTNQINSESGGSRASRVKKRQGLKAIRDMLSSPVMNVRMEPGF